LIRLADIAARTVWTPAPEKSADDYKDAFYPEETSERHGLRGVTRFCLADGASASSLSRQWAKLLVSEWGSNPDTLGYARSLSLATAAWDEWYNARESRRTRHVDTKTWFQNSFPEDSRAHATLLVVQIYPGRYPCWFALAVGDTFVFHVRADSLLESLPKRTARRAMPHLLSSDGATQTHLREVAGKDLSLGDELFLATDALARWIFDSLGAGRVPWPTLRVQLARGTSAFHSWIEQLRRDGQIEPDDTTLTWITTGR
jgi:hypothetical protein